MKKDLITRVLDKHNIDILLLNDTGVTNRNHVNQNRFAFKDEEPYRCLLLPPDEDDTSAGTVGAIWKSELIGP